jgi:Zn-dependent protease with chaperone function
VIGHEIGHVIARHHEERITRQMGAQTGLAVLGALAGAAYGDGAASTVNQLGGMGARLPAAGLAHAGKRGRRGRPAADGQAGFDPARPWTCGRT